MKHHCHSIARRVQRRRQGSALDRIAEHLERSSKHSNAERIRRMRLLFFADVDALQKSGEVQLPE